MHGSTHTPGSANANPSPDRERPGLVVRGEHPVPVGCSFARRLRHSRGKGELRAARLLRCGPRLPLAARPIIQTRPARTGATADHGGKQRRPIRLDRGYQPIDYRVPLQGERESGDHCLCRLECKYLLRERPHESTPATLTRRPNGSALPGDVLAQGPAETDLPQPRTHSQAAPRPATPRQWRPPREHRSPQMWDGGFGFRSDGTPAPLRRPRVSRRFPLRRKGRAATTQEGRNRPGASSLWLLAPDRVETR